MALLNSLLNILRVMITPLNDDYILEPSSDKQCTIQEKTKIPRA